MKKLTAPWIRKADSDLRAARTLVVQSPPFHDEACFHCQQAVEKYFKAMLQELGLFVPKIHELKALLMQLLPHDATLAPLKPGLDRLSRFAVDYRYPGFHADARKAKAVIRLAERVRIEIRTRRGLRTKT